MKLNLTRKVGFGSDYIILKSSKDEHPVKQHCLPCQDFSFQQLNKFGMKILVRAKWKKNNAQEENKQRRKANVGKSSWKQQLIPDDSLHDVNALACLIFANLLNELLFARQIENTKQDNCDSALSDEFSFRSSILNGIETDVQNK